MADLPRAVSEALPFISASRSAAATSERSGSAVGTQVEPQRGSAAAAELSRRAAYLSEVREAFDIPEKDICAGCGRETWAFTGCGC